MHTVISSHFPTAKSSKGTAAIQLHGVPGIASQDLTNNIEKKSRYGVCMFYRGKICCMAVRDMKGTMSPKIALQTGSDGQGNIGVTGVIGLTR